MATIRVDKRVGAPIELVFERLTDHANYVDFRGITDSKLTHEGETERNGLGARRSIASGPIRFEEEITAFERPTRMDYLIREVNAPIEHEGGMITLAPDGDGTRVLWVSTFQVPIRAVGPALGALMAATIKLGFISILRDVERLTGQS